MRDNLNYKKRHFHLQVRNFVWILIFLLPLALIWVLTFIVFKNIWIGIGGLVIYFFLFALLEEKLQDFNFDLIWDWRQLDRDRVLSDNRPFILILRGFELPEFNSLQTLYSFRGESDFSKLRDISSLIGEAVSPFANALAIFPIGDHSFSRLTEFKDELVFRKLKHLYFHNDQWLQVVGNLSQRALFVVVTPCDSQGVRDEMQYLRDHNLLSKTLVLMPPSLEALGPGTEVTWERCQTYLSEYNFRLPPYSRKGMLYVPDDFFSITRSFALQNEMNNKEIRLDLAFAYFKNSWPQTAISTKIALDELDQKFGCTLKL